METLLNALSIEIVKNKKCHKINCKTNGFLRLKKSMKIFSKFILKTLFT